MFSQTKVLNALEEKGIVQHERISKEAIFFGLLLYFKVSSLRSVAEIISLSKNSHR